MVWGAEPCVCIGWTEESRSGETASSCVANAGVAFTTTHQQPCKPTVVFSVPARHISESAAPCPYCLAPCPNSLAPCPIYIAPCLHFKKKKLFFYIFLFFFFLLCLHICAHVFIDCPQNCARILFRSRAGLCLNFLRSHSKLCPIFCRLRTTLCPNFGRSRARLSPISFAPCPFPNLAGTLSTHNSHWRVSAHNSRWRAGAHNSSRERDIRSYLTSDIDVCRCCGPFCIVHIIYTGLYLLVGQMCRCQPTPTNAHITLATLRG